LGLSGLGETDWSELLDRARALVREGSQGEADLVAVAYADWQAAGSPEPGALLEHALERKFPFFLVDTYDKQAGDRSAVMDWDKVAVLAERARSGGIRFVAAGKLGAAQLGAAAAAGVDVIAVRGAATTGERTACVDRRAVDELSRLIHEELTAG
ncbi:MAG: (5-formylfuran-3-yl)methyl phosphate synthase, partial [Planctomycetota bacterium]|nr:(5-formylfuran-3-yl)methyl phosphate synthase [Planctomycetota bacterium]